MGLVCPVGAPRPPQLRSQNATIVVPAYEGKYPAIPART